MVKKEQLITPQLGSQSNTIKATLKNSEDPDLNKVSDQGQHCLH